MKFQKGHVTRAKRGQVLGQSHGFRGCTVWFTGNCVLLQMSLFGVFKYLKIKAFLLLLKELETVLCVQKLNSILLTEFKAAFTWNRYEIGTDQSCVYTGPGGSGTDRICYLVPNGFIYEGDPMWNRTVMV